MSFDLNSWAQKRGWAAAGVSAPDLSETVQKQFETWLRDFKGEGLEYLDRRKNERLNPRLYFPAVQSVLVFGLYYFPGWARGPIKVSNYSWGRDYHDVLKEKLGESIVALQKEIGACEYRICVDTSPVLEKAFAVQAGLGWQGKNTLLMNTEQGSQLFLGEIFSTWPDDLFQRPTLSSDRCGTCTRCIDACPTKALDPYVLSPEKCISYWTLEHRGAFNTQTPKFTEWIAGCDICQEVCPWNRDLLAVKDSEIDYGLRTLTEDELEPKTWKERIKDRAISYVPTESWERNRFWIESIENT